MKLGGGNPKIKSDQLFLSSIYYRYNFIKRIPPFVCRVLVRAVSLVRCIYEESALKMVTALSSDSVRAPLF